MISVTSQNVSFGHRRLARHAEQIADQAAGLIRSNFGVLPDVQVLVSSRSDVLADFVHESKLTLLPGADPREVAKQLRTASPSCPPAASSSASTSVRPAPSPTSPRR